jgi:hypothetical protein
MTRESQFSAACERFDAIHREDPRRGERAAEGRPWSLVYHERLAWWVERLAPEASEALRLAARSQHLRRWAIARDRYPEGRAGYRRWRAALAALHADEAGRILGEVGYDDATIDRVRELLTKRGLGTDHEVQLFEDAICLTFLENELASFAAKHQDDKLVSILQKTWRKMSPAGRSEALELSARLAPALRRLIERALAGTP